MMFSDVKTGVFLQARLGSTRLPHKILLDLDGHTVLERCMQRLSLVEADCHVVLTDKYSYDILSRICANQPGWDCFMGPANDVLARYVFAARHYDVQQVIRATADNPVVSFDLANQMLQDPGARRADYFAHTGIPYGAGVEMVKVSALETAFLDSDDPYDHEHVCPYLYNHSDKFIVRRQDAPLIYRQEEMRLTLDTEEDYRYLKALFSTNNLSSLPSLSTIIKNMYSVAV